MNLTIHIVGRRELDSCPAAVVYTPGGDTAFLVNRDVLSGMPPAQQRFILAHELGHRCLGTDSEELADAFALGLVAGRQPRSLLSSLRAVASMKAVPLARLEQLYRLCLLVDRNRKRQPQKRT